MTPKFKICWKCNKNIPVMNLFKNRENRFVCESCYMKSTTLKIDNKLQFIGNSKPLNMVVLNGN